MFTFYFVIHCRLEKPLELYVAIAFSCVGGGNNGYVLTMGKFALDDGT